MMERYDKVYIVGKHLSPTTELTFMGFTESGNPILRDHYDRDFIEKQTTTLAKVEIVW